MLKGMQDPNDTLEASEFAWTVEPAQAGLRLDAALVTFGILPELSRSRVAALIETGQIHVNGRPAKPALKLKGGEVVTGSIPEPKELTVEPQDLPLDVIYEDADLIVVNKAKGVATHPAPGNWDGTLVNALLFHCRDLSGIGGVLRPGIVHRLDKDTSGLLVVAKSEVAHRHLAKQIETREAHRYYLAVVVGHLPQAEGTISAPIGRHPVDRIKMAVVESGRPATTHWRVKESFAGFQWVELKLDTGRTHQIRVHLSYLKHPVVGDETYGGNVKLPVRLTGQALHAWKLSFVHPKSGERLTFEAPLPEEMGRLVNYLRETRS